jgi:D-serine deaminase-like pyridoxal phosphate-dependent protein
MILCQIVSTIAPTIHIRSTREYVAVVFLISIQIRMALLIVTMTVIQYQIPIMMVLGTAMRVAPMIQTRQTREFADVD